MTQPTQAQAQADCKKVSDAYLRLRALIPGAFNTAHAPTLEQVYETTEAALKAALTAAAQVVEPTEDRIEAEMNIIERLQSKSLMTPAYDAKTMDLAKDEIEQLRGQVSRAQSQLELDDEDRASLLDQITKLEATAQVREPVDPSWDNAITATIERCAQVAEATITGNNSYKDDRSREIAAAIRKLKDVT